MKDRFSNLFDVVDKKLATMSNMFSLGWGRMVRFGNDGGDCWLGRRN